MEYVFFYVLIINALTGIITVYDKIAAKKLPKKRIPEKTLFLLAFIGGSPAELLVMCLIRHKTKHKKFMVGLPVILVLQIGAAAFYLLAEKGIISF